MKKLNVTTDDRRRWQKNQEHVEELKKNQSTPRGTLELEVNGQKVCTGCPEVGPQGLEEFYNDSRSADKKGTRCKTCCAKKNEEIQIRKILDKGEIEIHLKISLEDMEFFLSEDGWKEGRVGPASEAYLILCTIQQRLEKVNNVRNSLRDET